MARSVRTIPATINRQTAMPITDMRNRRVAAYARVSTDHAEQLTSYAAQVKYYTNYIKSREDWDFAGMYTDEGITGTSTKQREGFKKMVRDALGGSIDLIITKSVSRFARNTVDSLTTIRKLKAAGVECYFEKENIWTFDGKGELLLTIMSSLAQEESRSISENCTWGQRKRFADGKVTVPFSHFLGYDRGADGELVLNEKEADVVRRIYALYLSGLSPRSICKRLMADGIPSPGGKPKWYDGTVRSILTNEKYIGDALLQKRFTADFLTKKQKVNEGEVPQYYVENDHEPIVSRGVFDAVRQEMEKRRKAKRSYSGVGILSSRIYCGECDGCYGSKVWHSTDKYRKVVYRCNRKYDKKHEHCSSPTLTEAEVRWLFVKAVNQFLDGRDVVIERLEGLLANLRDTTKLELETADAESVMMNLAEHMDAAISRNAHVAADQDEYRKVYSELESEYSKAKASYDKAAKNLNARKERASMLEMFIDSLKAQKGALDDFDERLWASLLDRITAYTRERIVFRFKDGTETTVGL